MLGVFRNNLKQALRSIIRNPGFSGLSIVILAVAMGSNLAIFSVIRATLWKTLPVPHPNELEQIYSVDRNGRRGTLFSKILPNLRENRSVFAGVCAFARSRFATDIGGSLRSTEALAVSGDCFATLGLPTEIGRTFSLADDVAGGEHVAVLTYRFWQTAFNGAHDVLGKQIRIQGELFTVVGVTKSDFTTLQFGTDPGVLIPIGQTPGSMAGSAGHPIYYWVDIIARRAAGVSERGVQAHLNATARRLLEESAPLHYNPAQRAEYSDRWLRVSSGASGVNWWFRERFRTPLFIVLGICICVLLVACVNLLGVLLARILRRHSEFGLRQALGAGRMAIASLLIVESSLLVTISSFAGILFALWARAAVASALKRTFAIDLTSAIDFPTIIAACCMTVSVLFFFALVSVAYTGRIQWGSIDRAGRAMVGRNTGGQKVLLSVQLALTLTLVACGIMLGFSFENINGMDLGIRTDGVSEAFLAPTPEQHAGQSSLTYYQDLLATLDTLPGVTAAALSDYAPLLTGEALQSVRTVETKQSISDLRAQPVFVSEQFFDTLGIPIIAGEAFHRSAVTTEEPVAIVSESLASFIGNQQAIGRHIEIGDEGHYQRVRIVGIARDAKLSLEHPESSREPVVYVNVWDQLSALRSPVLLLSLRQGSPIEQTEVAKVVASRGREYVETYTKLNAAKDQALAENRALASLSRMFAVFALVLAATGLFGMISYYVTSRTREIGLRIALGATPLGVIGLIIRQVIPIVTVGSVIGLVLTLLVGRLMSSMIVGFKVYDLRLLAASVVVLLLTAMLSLWLPARRAISVDPMVALRQD